MKTVTLFSSDQRILLEEWARVENPICHEEPSRE
jgi:hypothetical protein